MENYGAANCTTCASDKIGGVTFEMLHLGRNYGQKTTIGYFASGNVKDCARLCHDYYLPCHIFQVQHSSKSCYILYRNNVKDGYTSDSNHDVYRLVGGSNHTTSCLNCPSGKYSTIDRVWTSSLW